MDLERLRMGRAVRGSIRALRRPRPRAGPRRQTIPRSLDAHNGGRGARRRGFGRFRHRALGPADYPAVGDWTAVKPGRGGGALIEAVLPRRSAFVRKAAGEITEAQVVAANVDTVFLVSGLDGDFNLRRIERYLTTAWTSGAAPVVVLNKADLRPDLESFVRAAAEVAAGVPVVAVSALTADGLAGIEPYLAPGRTVALLGSSGVGKSTLTNRLLGAERFRTAAMSDAASGRGRHTTSSRELVRLPGGALLIDTPGMRELQLWADDSGLDRTFEEIEKLAARCRFPDCRHEREPDCAVRAAVESGDPGRRAAGQLPQAAPGDETPGAEEGRQDAPPGGKGGGTPVRHPRQGGQEAQASISIGGAERKDGFV